MKSNLLLTLAFVCCAIALPAQSTDRFIRIVGNAATEFQADTYRVYFNVSEIIPSSYDKGEYKSLEQNTAETMEVLKKIGIKETQVSRNYKNKNAGGYNNAKTDFYYVDVTDKDMLTKLLTTKTKSFNTQNIKFLYLHIDPNAELNLSKAAISDAERKAKSIAKEIGKKVGKILNIEDKSVNCCSDFGEIDQETTTRKYALNITFELID